MSRFHISHPDSDFGSEFHHPEDKNKERKVLHILILINLLGMIVEIVGGIWTNSLALLSDAGHMFTHLFSLIVAYLAIVIGMRRKTLTMTFGYFRMEILAAFFNSITIFAIVFLIAVEAFHKFMQPTPIRVKEMFFLAVFGLFVNLFGAWILMGSAKKDINLRAVLVHLLSDTFSSVAIIVGGVIIYYTNWFFIDAIASVIIAIVIAYWGWGLLKTSSKILLQAVPEAIDPEKVVQAILEIPEIKEVHDVHIWELTTKKYVMTGHILTDNINLADSKGILQKVNKIVQDQFSIGHTTFQFEAKS
jgi:cobalt-zinc-cadmium efflux system protein